MISVSPRHGRKARSAKDQPTVRRITSGSNWRHLHRPEIEGARSISAHHSCAVATLPGGMPRPRLSNTSNFVWARSKTFLSRTGVDLIRMRKAVPHLPLKRVFEKSWFHQSIEHEAECDRVDYPRRLNSAVVTLATVGTFQTPSQH